LKAFEIAMLNEGLGDRTIDNRIGEVVTFLRAHGIKDVTHRRKYTEKVVTAYRKDEVERLLAAADAEEKLLWQFFLFTGAREQEVMNAAWNDIDFVDGLWTCKEKTDWTDQGS
jgi:integrase